MSDLGGLCLSRWAGGLRPSYSYSVLYYNPSQSYVGIAGKPFSTNDGSTQPAQHLSGSAVGGIIAGVLVALIALLLCVYVQKRDSWEGMHHRMLRHQQKIVDAQMSELDYQRGQ